MAPKLKPKTVVSVGPRLAKIRERTTALTFQDGQVIYSQGDIADSVYFIQEGWVKRTPVCKRGKEAVLGIFGPGDFFGERSLMDGRHLRSASAVSVGRSIVVRVKKESVAQLLQDDPEFSRFFLSRMVQRADQAEESLVDRHFYSTERRLARLLLRLASFGYSADSDTVVPRISQEILAQMIGASRSRVSSFFNKFKRLGLIEYDGGLRVYRSRLSAFLQN